MRNAILDRGHPRPTAAAPTDIRQISGRSRRPAARPRHRPLHPRPDPGAHHLHPRHRRRRADARRPRHREQASATCTTTTSRPSRTGESQAACAARPPRHRPRRAGRALAAARAARARTTSPTRMRLSARCSSSNGSTSMASVCGSTLALMDAGVPIKAPVAGIAMGLVTDADGRCTRADRHPGHRGPPGRHGLQGGRHREGITGLQMDIKITRHHLRDHAARPSSRRARPACSSWTR